MQASRNGSESVHRVPYKKILHSGDTPLNRENTHSRRADDRNEQRCRTTPAAPRMPVRDERGHAERIFAGGREADEHLVAHVLAQNLGDYMSLKVLHLTLLSQKIRSTQEPDVLLFLEQLLNRGLMSIGDLHGNEFVPWDCGVSEVIQWIRQDSPASLEWADELANTAWLNNTQHGNDVGRTIIQAHRGLRKRLAHPSPCHEASVSTGYGLGRADDERTYLRPRFTPTRRRPFNKRNSSYATRERSDLFLVVVPVPLDGGQPGRAPAAHSRRRTHAHRPQPGNGHPRWAWKQALMTTPLSPSGPAS